MGLVHFLGRWRQGFGRRRHVLGCRQAVPALLAAAIVAAPAPGLSQEAGKAALLIVDANSGRVLQQSAADAPRHPASLAKLMTLYLVFERIEQRRLSYATRIRFSANAVAAAPSKLDLAEGAEISLIDAIKVLITKSANDVAVAIAERIAGSEANFARLMTQKAHQLGMTATTFRNASGLPDEEQVTSARDMVTLTLHLQDDFPKHYPLFATRYATYDGETFPNHNALLFHFPGTDGLKTGYTHASGFNLVASVRRGRKHVVGAIFGGTSAASRDRAMQSYLLRALAQASNERTRSTLPVRVALSRTAPRAQATAPPVAEGPRPARAQPPAIPVAATSPPPAPVPARPAMPSDTAVPAPAASPPADAATAQGIALPRVRHVLLTGGTVETGVPVAPPRDIAALLSHDQGPTPGKSAGGDLGQNAPASRLGGALPAGDAAGSVATAAATKGGAGLPPDASAGMPAVRGRAPKIPSPAASQRVAAAPPAPAAAVGAAFLIQIGAYASQAEAERQLARARDAAPLLLGGRAPITQQVTQGDRLLYRARYGGFVAATASEACQSLQRQGIACLVIKGQ